MQLIIPSSYFPPILDIALHADPCFKIKIAAQENYQKRSSRNRCIVLSSTGKELLSVPLKKGKNAGIPIGTVRIAQEMDWVKQHLKAILCYYQNAPYYDYYITDITAILNKKHDYLFELNMATLNLFKRNMNLNFDVETTVKYQSNNSEILKKYTQQKMSKQLFKYNQVYDNKLGFTDGLSGLDLLFNQGPESITILKPLADDFRQWYRHNYS